MFFSFFFDDQVFASRVKELRTAKGLTMEALAKEIHGTKAAIGNFENANKKPSLDAIIALADYFGVTIDYLVGKSDLPDYSASEDTVPFPLLPERLKELREQRNMDIFNAADIIEENPRNYVGYEAGEVLPKLRTICALADYFDVSLDYLVGRSDDPQRH